MPLFYISLSIDNSRWWFWILNWPVIWIQNRFFFFFYVFLLLNIPTTQLLFHCYFSSTRRIEADHFRRISSWRLTWCAFFSVPFGVPTREIINDLTPMSSVDIRSNVNFKTYWNHYYARRRKLFQLIIKEF